MLYKSPEGYSIYYQYNPSPKKRNLILCNGIGQHSGYWDVFIHALNEQYNTLSFDFPNQGQSSTSQEVLSTKQYAKIIVDLCNHLNISQSVGIGNAFGGLAMKIAFQMQAGLFDKMVFVSCFAQRNKRMSRYAENTKNIVESIVSEQDFLKLFGQDWLEQSFVEMFGPAYSEAVNDDVANLNYFNGVLSMMNSLQNSESDLTSEIHKIKIPVLVVQGGLDQIIPPQNGFQLTQALSKGHYAEIKFGKHILQCSHPQELAQTVDAFLNRSKY